MLMLVKGNLTQIFPEEYRNLRETLLDLIGAFEEGSSYYSYFLLRKFIRDAGPLFRYTEEALYPSLTGVVPEEQIQDYLDEHHRTIVAVRELMKITELPVLRCQDREYAIDLIRGILPDVHDFESLAVLVESWLSESQQQWIFRVRDRAYQVGLNLLQWREDICLLCAA